MSKNNQMDEGESLEVLLKRVVEACQEFNDAVFYHHGFGEAADQFLGKLYCEKVGFGGLQDIKELLAEIVPPIEQEDRERLAKAPIKSRDVGDKITEDAVYFVLNAAIGVFQLLISRKPEGDSLLAREGLRVHLNEIMRLPPEPKDDPTEWGRVLTEVIWHRQEEPILHVNKADLEAGGSIYGLIIADAETACQRRKGKRDATFQRRCGLDHRAFLSLDDAGRLKLLEDRSKTPEERDKAAVRAAQLLTDAKSIEAISVSPGELKEALRDRLVERLKRALR